MSPGPQDPFDPATSAELVLLAAAVEDLANTVAVQSERLDTLAARSGAGTGGTPDGAADDGPPRWRWAETDPDEAGQLLAVLSEWVDWLRERYQLAARIREDWAQCPAMVEELTALRLAHVHVYGPRAGWSEPLWWHEALARALARLEQWQTEATKRAGLAPAGGCTTGWTRPLR